MRTLFTSVAFGPETETGSVILTPSGIPAGANILPDLSATDPAIPPLPATAKPAKPAKPSSRKLSSKAVAAASSKPAKPAKPVSAGKPEAKPETFGSRGTYNGASPTFRGHGRKLSPIVLDRVPGSFTERDARFLADLHAKHGTKPFPRLDCDAGNVSRAIGHGYIKHASGNLDSRTATFAVTERYVRERKQAAKATPPAKR